MFLMVFLIHHVVWKFFNLNHKKYRKIQYLQEKININAENQYFSHGIINVPDITFNISRDMAIVDCFFVSHEQKITVCVQFFDKKLRHKAKFSKM